MSEDTGSEHSGGTKVFYYCDDEDTPYLVKLNIPPEEVTLKDLKNALPNKCFHKFFFKCEDSDFGFVKQEISNDSEKLPCVGGKIIAWVCDQTENGSKHSSDHHHSNHHQNNDRNIKFDKATVFKTARQRSDGWNDTVDSSLFESEDDRFSYTTETTNRSHRYRLNRKWGSGGPPRTKYNLQGGRAYSRASSASSVTDSEISLYIIEVCLHLDSNSFLGISVVGQQTTDGVDSGIFVGSVMKGGAAFLDGRIQSGDMILEVNGVSLDSLSNDEAVAVLRKAVVPSPEGTQLRLVLNKSCDRDDDEEDDGFPSNNDSAPLHPRGEPVRPIDPGAWIAHTHAMRAAQGAGPLDAIAEATSLSNLTNDSSIPDHHGHMKRQGDSLNQGMVATLSLSSPLATVVRALASPQSGLPIKERTWLKLKIQNAFIGYDLLEWLQANIIELSNTSSNHKSSNSSKKNRKLSKLYANNLLKSHYIRCVLNSKTSFSSNCYYLLTDVALELTTTSNNYNPQSQQQSW